MGLSPGAGRDWRWAGASRRWYPRSAAGAGAPVKILGGGSPAQRSLDGRADDLRGGNDVAERILERVHDAFREAVEHGARGDVLDGAGVVHTFARARERDQLGLARQRARGAFTEQPDRGVKAEALAGVDGDSVPVGLRQGAGGVRGGSEQGHIAAAGKPAAGVVALVGVGGGHG